MTDKISSHDIQRVIDALKDGRLELQPVLDASGKTAYYALLPGKKKSPPDATLPADDPRRTRPL